MTPSVESLPHEGTLRLLPGFAEEATGAAALRLLDAAGETPRGRPVPSIPVIAAGESPSTEPKLP